MKWTAGWVLAAGLMAGPPVINDLQPRGAQKGRPFTLTLTGRDLSDILRVHSTMPATFTPLTAEKPAGLMGGEGRYASFLVEPKAELGVGVYPIRVETADGISNIQLFAVGSFPEVAEEESQPGSLPNRNDTIENAQSLPSAAVTLNGSLRGPERDLYRLQVKAGERRVFEIEGRRAGSAIDPVIRLLDGTGKQLARSEDSPLLGLDTRLEHTFAKEGYYYVEVTDARFSSQGANFYRLKTGGYAYPTELFPLGGPRGGTVEVALGGAQKTVANLKDLPAKLPVTFVNLPGEPAALPLPFDLGEYPEVTEPAQPVDLPVTVNGRLAKAGEVDRFALNVKPGDDLILDVRARDLGTSKIMAVITVSDESGKRIVRSGDEPLPEELYAVTNSKTAGDPYVAFKVPAGVRRITVAIEDLALRGGTHYAYRLSARREANAFTASIGMPYINIPAGGTVIVPVNVNRKGYQGDVKLRVVNPPKGLLVEGGYIPPENTNYVQGNRGLIRRGTLLLTAEPGVRIAPTELQIEAVGWLPNGTILTQRATGPGMLVNVAGATIQGALDRQRPVNAPWLGLELPAAGTRPLPATLSVKLEKTTRKATGDEFLFRWKWNARGVQVPDAVGIEIVGGADVRAIEMAADPKDRTTGTFLLTTTRLTLPGRYDFYINGRVTVEGQPEDIYSRPVALVIEEPVETNKENLSASAGSQ